VNRRLCAGEAETLSSDETFLVDLLNAKSSPFSMAPPQTASGLTDIFGHTVTSVRLMLQMNPPSFEAAVFTKGPSQ
jgi:hypothetical protein